MADLKIVITGDASGYEASLKDSEKATKDLEISLDQIAKASAIAFAGLTATIGLSVANFNDARKSANDLTLALENQGIYTDALNKQYKSFATSIANKTGLDDDAIIKAQAVAQSYLGQKIITQDLTQAIVDLSVTMGGDLNGAAEKIARTIGTSTNAFARQGLVLSDTASESERYQKVLDFVRNKTAGLAEEANNSTSGLTGLKTAVGDLSENIGERFSPIVGAAAGALTNLIKSGKDSDTFIAFSTGLLASATAMTGIVSSGAGAVAVIANIGQALVALNITISATRLAIIALASATGIGLLIVALGTLGAYFLDNSRQLENFKKNLPGARDEIARLQEQIAKLDQNGQRVGDGSLRVEVQAEKAALQQRVDQIKAATKDEMAAEDERLAQKKIAADKEAAIRQDQLARDQSAQRAKTAVILGEANGESDKLLAARKAFADNLQSQASSQNAAEIAALKQNYTEKLNIVAQQEIDDINRRKEFAIARAEADAALEGNGQDDSSILADKELESVRAQAQSRLEVDKKAASDRLLVSVQAQNTYLANEKKYGETYAKLKKQQDSEVYQGAKAGFEGLAELQESSNGVLKGIGKAAAIANIGIKTAESAMNIYAGFSTIPIIGPALGTAAAAAAIAFGAEQAGKVAGFAQGGIVTGGMPGRDSVPAMLMPGEIVTPKASFEETIGSVRAAREAKKIGGGDNSDVVGAIAALSDRLDNLGGSSSIIVQGDVLADDAYIERFADKLGDFLQFRNGKLRGVNA